MAAASDIIRGVLVLSIVNYRSMIFTHRTNTNIYTDYFTT